MTIPGSLHRAGRHRLPLLAGLLLVLSSGQAWAAEPHRVGSGNPWTAERVRDAKPKPMPERTATPEPGFTTLERAESSGGAPAQPPRIDPGDSLDVQLYEPERPRQRRRAADEDAPSFEPQSLGSTGAAFSQSRVFPNGAIKKFPFRAIGKLFAYDPVLDADFTCSAAVVERRLVATAGHCVFDFNRGRGYFLEDIEFVPAYDRGRARFGTWEIDRVWVAPSWLRGNGRLPNAADYALMSVRDQRVGGRKTSIGDVVGWLGWRAASEVGHAALIGYPGNLDRGERMQVTHAEVFADVRPNSIEFGSAQSGGSSGGPIVEDLGQAARGQRDGGDNRMVSIISFGVDEESTLGGSLLGDEFNNLMKRACQIFRNCADN
jgi:V8-like Glu-specific endopeptidase